MDAMKAAIICQQFVAVGILPVYKRTPVASIVQMSLWIRDRPEQCRLIYENSYGAVYAFQ